MIRLDIATGKAKIFAYPINKDYKNSSGAKIGDIYALNSTDLLIIEQGADRDGNMQNRIYKISTTQATDITDKRIAGQEDIVIPNPYKKYDVFPVFVFESYERALDISESKLKRA